MVDTTIKTKAAMLHELESIKGLLLEEDGIPILQEVIEPQIQTTEVIKPAPRIIVEEQQDFFNSNSSVVASDIDQALDDELLDTIDELEKHTADVTANKFATDAHKASTRPSLAKATGENPFLPAHIRSRLHGNNPPPLFAHETARKIASSSTPARQLGNTSLFSSTPKINPIQHDIIDSVVEKLMPEIEKELRARLETLSKHMLDELNK